MKRFKVAFSKNIEAGLRKRLFDHIQEATSLTDEGKVSWSTEEDVSQYISVLGDAFTFPPDISRQEAALAVSRGIFDARKTGKITDATVLECLQRLVDSRLAQTPKRFSIWTRVTYQPAEASDRLFQYEGVSIRLGSRLPAYMRVSDEEFRTLRPIDTRDTPSYGVIIASTMARNETQAADKLFAAIEVFQALYNLAIKPWNIFGSEQKPEALLLLGPYHFLFRDRKSLRAEANWYNQNFRKEHWRTTVSDSRKIYQSAPAVRKSLARLSQHPLKEPILSALLMMNDGMESPDMSRRTLRYWTALERLFQAGDERIAYDKIIRRATYLDDPSDLARAKLARLMRIRNRYVHMGTTENEHHQLTQYLASSVRSHLFYVLFNGDDFKDHAEFLEMTDLPSDAEALERRRRAIDRRERMITHRRHRPD